MNRIASSLIAAGAAVAIGACTVSAAQAAVLHDADGTTPAVHAHVRATAGRFAYEMTATSSGITDEEHFGRVRDGIGDGSRPEVEPDRIRTMGTVAGGTSFVTGVSGAHLSGVAGGDVVSVTVLPASGGRVPAVMDRGIWAAAWQGDPDAGGGRARMEFTTADGRQHTTSTDEVDWIAAEQRAAEGA